MHEEEPAVEYLYIDMKLKSFAKKLVDYPPIKDIDTNTSLEEYLRQVINVVAQLIPFDHKGIGVSELMPQVTRVTIDDQLPQPGTPFKGRLEVDCKLPAAVTAYLVTELAKQHSWPVFTEATSRKDSAHAYVAIRVKPEFDPESMPFSFDASKYLVVDYESFQGQALPGITPYPEDHHDALQRFGAIFEPNLIKGMQNFDRQYQLAIQDKYSPKE